jgi:uncharacterized membrane protein
VEDFGVLQAWLLIGIPALVLAIGLYIARTPVRSMLAFLVLAGAFVALAFIDRVSAAVFGALLALLYAAGRGGSGERAEQAPDWRRVEAS